MRSAATTLALVFAACSVAPDLQGGDVTVLDAGERGDGGHVADGGTSLDGGVGDGGTVSDGGPGDGGHALQVVAPSGARRGPILVRFPGATAPVTLALATGPATLKTAWTEGGGVLVAWDSFADVSSDGAVTLHATDAAGLAATFTLDVRDTPDVDRLVAVGHKSVDAPGGGATDDGAEVGLFAWSRAGSAGGPRRLTVGKGPGTLRAAPHGRAVVVVNETDGSVSVVTTPLDADLAGAAVLATLTLPGGSAADARWSPDGRYFYVAATGDGAHPPTLWRYEPSEDLSSVGAPVNLTTLPGPPDRFDVDRVHGRILVDCGSGGAGLAKLVLLGPDGAELARHEEDLDPANALTFDPTGTFALWTSGTFSEQVRVWSIGTASIAQAGPTLTTVRAPQDAIFWPGTGGAALVSNLNHDTVTPVLVSTTGASPRSPVAGVPLAAELDDIERGAARGTVFAVAVSQVYRLTLAPDGATTNRGQVIDFGAATTDLTTGIAVQR